MSQKFITVKGAARLYKVDERYIRKLCESGQMPREVSTTGKNKWLIPIDGFEIFLEDKIQQLQRAIDQLRNAKKELRNL